MSRFNSYMNSGFAGCRLLAHARDECRHRDVRLYQVPGYDEVVGVTDGVDSWIAPVSASVMSVNVARLFADMREGKPLPKPEPLSAPRRTLLDLPQGDPPLRRRPLTEDAPQPQPAQGARRVLLA